MTTTTPAFASLVTGGASGIGHAVATAALDRGAPGRRARPRSDRTAPAGAIC